MPDRPSFPVPEEPTPDTYCLCIPMPNDPTWKTVIAGLLWQPAEWFNWQRDDAKTGKILAQYWREKYASIDWSTMSCCCNDIPLSRFTSGGVYQTSNDGGATWVNSPNADPRNQSPQLPPLPTLGSAHDDKCRAATNATTAMQTAVNAFGSELGSVGSIIALAGAIALALCTVFVNPPASTVIIPIVIALAQAIYSIASGTYLALFTSAVYNNFQCILYCNIGEDGTFSQSNFTDILTAIDAFGFDPNVALTFTSVLQGWGLNGLNDAARGGSLDAGDCTDCPCDDPCSYVGDIEVCIGTDFQWIDTCKFTINLADAGSSSAAMFRFGNPTRTQAKFRIEASIGTANYGLTAATTCSDQSDAVSYGGESQCYYGGFVIVSGNGHTDTITFTILEAC